MRMVVLALAFASSLGCAAKRNPNWQDGGSSSGMSSGSSTSGTTTTGVVDEARCDGVIVFDDPFEAVPPPNADWYVERDPTAMAEVMDGTLHVSVEVTSADPPESSWSYGSRVDVPRPGTIGLELVSPPDMIEPAELRLSLGDGAWSAYFTVAEGLIEVRAGDDSDSLAYHTEFIDATAHRWLRVSWNDTGMVFETAQTPGQWVMFAEVPLYTPLADPFVEVSVSSWEPLVAELAQLGNVYVCDPS
jgi:hypothetical protein